jgi:glycosyltransferase involved in cell wall biosynthesis
LKKIVFISHYAGRTGAPILLLRLIEQIKISTDYEIIILLKTDGELREDFERLGKTFIWNWMYQGAKEQNSPRRFPGRLFHRKRITSPTKEEICQAEIFKEINEASFIFNNTIANAALLKQLPLTGKKVFSYFHELHLATQIISTRQELMYLNEISRKIFVPSKAVKSFFVNDYGFQEYKMPILKYIIPKETKSQINKQEDKIAKGMFLVGFCGVLTWRKGYEFVPLIIQYIIKTKNVKNIHFVWIGAERDSLEDHILKHDLQKMQLESYFTFLEPQKDVQSYMAQLDVFVLPSREDAFPLVVLEAASHGVPTVYFSDAGGIGEFLGEEAGVPVCYLNIQSMAEKIIQLKLNEENRISLGKRAQQKLNEYFNNAETIKDFIEQMEAEN